MRTTLPVPTGSRGVRRPAASEGTPRGARPDCGTVQAAVIRIAEHLSGWDGTLPGLLIAETTSAEARRSLLRQTVAKTLRLPPESVTIEHGSGRAPRITEPIGTSLHLSSASRCGLAALAVAAAPIGVDIERVEPDGAVPEQVLHPLEAALLAVL